MKLCKNQCKMFGSKYCKAYNKYMYQPQCSFRCNRRIPTFWWKLKNFFEKVRMFR